MITMFQTAVDKSLDNCPEELTLTVHLIQNWSKIVPSYSDVTVPMRLYIKQKILVISANAGQSMNIQYDTNIMINSINTFLKKDIIQKIIVKNQLNTLE